MREADAGLRLLRVLSEARSRAALAAARAALAAAGGSALAADSRARREPVRSESRQRRLARELKSRAPSQRSGKGGGVKGRGGSRSCIIALSPGAIWPRSTDGPQFGGAGRRLVCQEAALRPSRCLRPGEVWGRGRVCSCSWAESCGGPVGAEKAPLEVQGPRARGPMGAGDGDDPPSPANVGRGWGWSPRFGQIGDGDGGPSPSPDKSGMGTVALGSWCTEPDGEPERYSQPVAS